MIAWIPVREADNRTEPVPFDFVAERMIQVPRASDGELVLDESDQKLVAKLDATLAGW